MKQWNPVWENTPKCTEQGSYFIDGWKERHLEVYFPSQYTSHLPWEAYECDEAKDEVVMTLCHVTHKKEFDEICKSNPGSYTLKFNKKKGKSGYEKKDGSPLGFTFVAADDIKMPPNKRSKYKYVDSSTDLLPGSYLWWSIDNSIQYKPHRSKSRYGSRAIYGHIKFVFEHYQKSLPRDPLTRKFPKIELRIGGTLRYKFEICYVIIVCKEKEPTLPYDKYPVWPEGRKIRLNSKNLVSFIKSMKVKKIKGAASWNNHVFGFHFPHGQHQMICPKSDFNETDKIIHTSDNCIKKVPQKDLPPRTRAKWICPDEIASNTRIKRKRSNDSHEDERKSKRRHRDDRHVM